MRIAEARVPGALLSRRLALLAGLTWLAPAAADLTLEPAVAIGIAETDNLTLSSMDPERQTVYELLPSIGLTQQSARLSTDLALAVEAYRYDERGDSDVFQQLNADSELVLDPGNLFLDFGASRNQSVISPEDPIPQSNLPISTNRVDRDDYYFGPRFLYPVGDTLAFGGSYRRNATRYDEDKLTASSNADFTTDTLTVGADNYRKERGFTWAVGYDTEKTEYNVFEPWEYRQATIEVGHWLTPGWRLFAAGGQESAWDDPSDPSLADTFWEVGFARGSEDFQLELAAGERTFGSSMRAAFDYTFGRGHTSLHYAEQPTTQRQDPSSGVMLPDLLEDALIDRLERPNDAQRFLLNRLDWTLSFDLQRTGIALVLFDETREERFGLDGTPLEDETQRGGSLAFSWHLGSRTSLLMRADRSHRTFGGDREQDTHFLSIGGERRLGARTTLALNLVRVEEQSESFGFSNYKADLISLVLARTF